MPIRTLIDFIFPPLCRSCKEECRTRVLCPACWLNCEFPDPVLRCRHCFEELDQRGNLCAQCREKRILSAARAYVFDPESPARFLDHDATNALAGFALLQWIQLEWPMPDAIIPMPNSLPIAQAFASLLEVPFVRALKSTLEYKENRLEEDRILLLFDVSNSIEDLQKASLALSEAFPERVYLLSLFPQFQED